MNPPKNTPINPSVSTAYIKYGRTSTIDTLFDRLFGRAILPIEAEISSSKIEDMTNDEIKAEIDKIDKELGL